jgi:UDP-N-acetylmuramyl pentapeptide phosphotransferase/UDP-N-acetylglucosamine-1-phosphate transferase
LALFLLNGRDLSKLILALLLSTALFGLTGLCIVLVMQWLTLQTYATEGAGKHGIAEVQASRLGGLGVFFGVCISLVYFAWNESYGLAPITYSGVGATVWTAIIICTLLGLVEDVRNGRLSPRFRLIAKALVLLVVFIVIPSLVPSAIGLPLVDWFLGFSVVALMVTLLFSVGFLNAVNMADGANGLLPGILVITFYIMSREVGGVEFASLLIGCGVFLIYNTISGRLFLGDAGSYGLGATLLLSSLFVYSAGMLSLSFLAVLFFYPCFDLLVSIVRRRLRGVPMMQPDNDHLHNRVYRYFKTGFTSKTTANSVTGLSVALGSSGFALLGYAGNLIPITSHLWLGVFLLQCVLYGVIFVSLGKETINLNNSDLVSTTAP